MLECCSFCCRTRCVGDECRSTCQAVLLLVVVEGRIYSYVLTSRSHETHSTICIRSTHGVRPSFQRPYPSFPYSVSTPCPPLISYGQTASFPPLFLVIVKMEAERGLATQD